MMITIMTRTITMPMAKSIPSQSISSDADAAEAVVAEVASAAAEQDEAFNETGIGTESDYLAV